MSIKKYWERRKEKGEAFKCCTGREREGVEEKERKIGLFLLDSLIHC